MHLPVPEVAARPQSSSHPRSRRPASLPLYLPSKLNQVGAGSTDHPRRSPAQGAQGRKSMGTRVWHPGEIHPNQAPQLQHLGAPYICGSMRKGSKGSVQAKGNVVNADTHLVPTPPATQGSSSRSARPQGGCILSGGDLVPCLCPPGPGAHRGHSLFSALLIRTSGLHTAGRLGGSGRRGDSGTGELGNVWSCEWLGAPWREAPSGEAPRCTTSEGGAGRPAHLAGTRLQDDPRGLYTLLSPLTAPTLQLQFTAGCSGAPPDCPVFQAWDKCVLLSSRD